MAWNGQPAGTTAGYQAVKAADIVLGIGLPAAQNATTLNGQTGSPQDVQWGNIRDILINNADWGFLALLAELPIGATIPGSQSTISIQLAGAARYMRDGCRFGGTLKASVSSVWTALTNAANLLTPTGAISNLSVTQASALLLPPLWQPPLSANDILAARALP